MAHASAELYGSDRQLAETVAGLRAAGAEVVVALPSTGPLVACLEALGARVEVVDVPVLRKSDLRPRRLVDLAVRASRSGPAYRLLRDVDPHVVLVNTVAVPSWQVLARAQGVPVVVHVHETEDAVARVLQAGLLAPLHLANLVLTNSAAAGEWVRGVAPGARRRVRVLHNGVPGPDRPLAPLPTTAPTAPRLALVGRISPRKGTDVAVRALAALRGAGVDASLELSGGVFSGYEPFQAQVRDLAYRSGVAPSVCWTGFVDDVWPVYERADVVLVPSRQEPFGNVAVEAAHARRPLVASAVQGLRDVVDGGTGVLVAPDDPLALADGVCEVLSDWDAAHAMTQRALLRARRLFSTERYRQRVATAVLGQAGRATG